MSTTKRTLTTIFTAALLWAPVTASADDGDDTVLKVTISGAGQRANTHTFGGQVRALGDKVSGSFSLVVHAPIRGNNSPAVVAASCKLWKLSDLNVVSNTEQAKVINFRAEGSCTTMTGQGKLGRVVARNTIQIVDRGSNDSIDINVIGSDGFAVPASNLNAGDFSIEIEEKTVKSKKSKGKAKGKGKAKAKGKSRKR